MKKFFNQIKTSFVPVLNKIDIKQLLLNTAFVLFVVSFVQRFIEQFFLKHSQEGWTNTEWLVNYQGGFVRRGLIGELLFFIAKNFTINVEWTMKILCLVCLVVVIVFFVWAFVKKGYALYILPMCFFFGTHVFGGMYWHKRDYLMLIFLIATLWFFAKNNRLAIKFFVANTVLIIALQVHEVIAFFSLPMLFLLLCNDYKHKGRWQSIVLSAAFLLPSIAAFFLTLHYHGNLETAQAIWDSWVPVANLKAATLTTSSHGALSAIGWTSDYAFQTHTTMNFSSKSMSVDSTVFWLMIIPVVYYIASNALLVFRKKEHIFTYRDKHVLSSVLIFQFLCLIPVALFLSCDLGRIFFYWVTSSFAIFLLIPKEKLEHIFPAFFSACTSHINNAFSYLLKPTKASVMLLMLFVGIPVMGFNFTTIIKSSMIYNILLALSEIF
ncbi:MAG: hypothetical protein FWC39_05350 [Bacteroidetes bacterium]|nr:hypothetical protein [Bacteroidota bacterium]